MTKLLGAFWLPTILGTTLAAPMPAPPMLPTPAPHIRFEGGDGSSCEKAIVIVAEHEPEGIRAERWRVWSKNPGAGIVEMIESHAGGRDLETIRFQMPDGSKRSLCFDITSFYGKP